MLVAVDQTGKPIGGAYQFAQVVRDGLVVDFMGAVDIVKALKDKVERQLGLKLTQAATCYPPGTNPADVSAIRYVLNNAELDCVNLIDEPSAANLVLNIQNGAVVDIGGGTTGIAVIKNGQVIYTADEATGGTHFSLVIAGANDISFEAAEDLKKDPANHSPLFPLVRPVMEKIASIISRHTANHSVSALHLVGGSSNFKGIAEVVQQQTGIPTFIPPHPMFVTPLGTAYSALPTQKD